MGSILNAKCECGFESLHIFVGGGFSNFTTVCDVPALCEKCGDLVVVNYLQKDLRCPKCQGKVVAYDDPSLRQVKASGTGRPEVFSWHIDGPRGAFVLPGADYLCPKCRKMTMQFIDEGNWD